MQEQFITYESESSLLIWQKLMEIVLLQQVDRVTCCPVRSIEGRAMLRSANFGELVEPRTRGKHYSPHSFRVAAWSVWNNLPRHLSNDDSSLEQFIRDLKTFLFAQAHSSEAPFRMLFKRRFINGFTYLLTWLVAAYWWQPLVNATKERQAWCICR